MTRIKMKLKRNYNSMVGPMELINRPHQGNRTSPSIFDVILSFHCDFAFQARLLRPVP